MRLTIVVTFALIAAAASVPGAQSRPSSSSTPPNGRYVAIGCVSRQGSGATPRYLLTDPRGDKPTMYRIQGDSAQLDRHVGHTVEVTGTLAPPPAGSSQYTLRMASLAWLTSSCSKGK